MRFLAATATPNFAANSYKKCKNINVYIFKFSSEIDHSTSLFSIIHKLFLGTAIGDCQTDTFMVNNPGNNFRLEIIYFIVKFIPLPVSPSRMRRGVITSLLLIFTNCKNERTK